MKGYKVFDPDWKCRGYQYAVGNTYKMDDKPKCCRVGFHFCTKLIECFNYYFFDPQNKVAEVEALGEIDAEADGSKHCTNKIKIVREITWEEVLRLVNTGRACTGRCNSGYFNSGNRNSGNGNSGNGNSGYYNSENYNSGNRNSGDWNSGNCNSGSWNSGSCNSGSWNSGSCNSGNFNSGNYNSGNRNSGDYNSGDWNKTSFSSGCFNTEEEKIRLFNKPSDWTFRDWIDSDARFLLNNIDHKVIEWIYSSDMTDEEKQKHPEAETTGGYLKKLDSSECAQTWWDSLTDKEKAVIKALPNFDPDIFYQCTGIKIVKQEE